MLCKLYVLFSINKDNYTRRRVRPAGLTSMYWTNGGPAGTIESLAGPTKVQTSLEKQGKLGRIAMYGTGAGIMPDHDEQKAREAIVCTVHPEYTLELG